MEMKAVISGSILAVGHEGDVLRIRFKNGLYEYHGVTDADFVALLGAESIGKAYHLLVNGKGLVGVKIEG